MKLLVQSLKTPAENLAFEEWLFRHFDDEVLRLWVNPSSVVVGKHQNALSESNFWYCREQGIPIVRRLSGGGTVYHDVGNVNFSFFRKQLPDRMIDYDRSLVLVQKALQHLGYPVTMSERHDLFLNEEKVSGNAQHIRNKRILHHGTILYDADRNALSKSIKRDNGVFEDKGVRSVRSPITNLRAYKDLGTTSQFLLKLTHEFEQLGFEIMAPLSPDLAELEAYINDKYSNDDWNFGLSPKYAYTNKIRDWHVSLEVEKGGIIKAVSILKDGSEQAVIEKALNGIKHIYDSVSEALLEIDRENEDLIRCLF